MRKVLSFFLLILIPFISFAQAPKRQNSSEILLSIKKLNQLGRVLYIAAHPDDENTRLIAYLSNEKLYNTGYLSVTRGDGGQNLIGSEIRERLGIIRTQELLEARRIDGGEQFFTRANDFGFSKHPEETFGIWDKEAVLSDMVWVIRNFKPDVIITRFNTTPGVTHGHHTASAILAEEAFVAAGDKSKFPEQLKFVNSWQPKRLFWNTSSWFYNNNKEFDDKVQNLVKVDVGGFNPLLGQSYPEVAAKSRSMHKSQGFGSSGVRGATLEYLEQVMGDPVEKDMFENINTSWTRLKGGDRIARLLDDVIRNYKPENPSVIVPQLLRIRALIQEMPDNEWKAGKLKEIEDVIKAATGLYLEISARDFSAVPGETIKLKLEAVNRSDISIKVRSVRYSYSRNDSIYDATLRNNEVFTKDFDLNIPINAEISQPYWLKKEGSLGMFSVDEQMLIGLPENPSALKANVNLIIGGQEVSYNIPVVFKRTDPVDGEQYRPFEIIPPVTLSIRDNVYVFNSEEPRNIQVIVKAGLEKVDGRVALRAPKGWKVTPESVPFSLKLKAEEETFVFKVTPTAEAGEAYITAQAKIGDKIYDRSKVSISYSHIPNQTIFPKANSKVVKPDLIVKGENIGYIMGAGDDIPVSLQQIGYQVKILTDQEISVENLKKFDAVIVGVRAYNTNENLKFHHPKLLEYVKQGGTLIIQYNTNGGLVTKDLGPYPLQISRDRVTVEDAPVKILKPDHRIMNYPNKITDKDFQGWVQERGLYFPSSWDENYQPILSSSDPGEPARDGGLLVAQYGEGYYIYTGYSWFRQLPAGVPGAFRIFSNMIAIGID
jgi:LmbE family N-acetylglucosaminyl deacetylase